MQTDSSLETDRRQQYLIASFMRSGYPVILAKDASALDLTAASVSETDHKILVLLPIPATASLLKELQGTLHSNHIVLGGNLPKDFTDFCVSRKISYIDYFKYPEIALQNAVATAEGAIYNAIQLSCFNLQGSHALVIGFGKCGEILADKLAGMKCHVSVSTRDSIAKARAVSYGYTLFAKDSYQDCDLIFNTAPALVITPKVIDRLKSDTVIIDIASSPGGTDFNYCLKKGITAKHCPGLPGRFSPKTSAEILLEHIQDKVAELYFSKN